MQHLEVINILKKDLNFTDQSIEKLKEFTKQVLKENINSKSDDFSFGINQKLKIGFFKDLMPLVRKGLSNFMELVKNLHMPKNVYNYFIEIIYL